MPKRMVDGDALWVSEKLLSVPEEYRAEYAWLLPLAQVNGCFECTPMLVWRSCYAAVRSNFGIEDVTSVLNAFEKAKMLFRWTNKDGKTFGFFVGAQREGRLPGQAERSKYKAPWGTGMLPPKELAQFLEIGMKEVSEKYRGLLAETSQRNRDTSLIGYGFGSGEGSGKGKHTAEHNVHNAQNAQSSPNPSHSQTQTEAKAEAASGDENGNDAAAQELAEGFSREWMKVIRYNPHADPKYISEAYRKLWVGDFLELLKRLEPDQVEDFIAWSHSPSQMEFNRRPLSLVKNRDQHLSKINSLKRAKAFGHIMNDHQAKLDGTYRPTAQPAAHSRGSTTFNIEDENDELA